MKLLISLTVVVVLIATALSCGSSSVSEGPDPRKVVIKVFGAMDRDDKAALTALLDLPELMVTLNEDYALQTESPRIINDPEEILADLTGDGRTKRTWFKLQRIIGDTRIISETNATVEVTFVDKTASQGYLTRFGLHKVNGRWRVYSFATVN